MNPQHVHIASAMRNNMTSTINASMMNDAMSDPSSEDDGDFDDSDLLASSVADEVTQQLMSAGPVGIAAAAAIATAKKRKRPHLFETNPSVRKRQQTRLLRKLRATIDEYTTRVGQQAVVLCCTPGKTQNMNTYRVFGSQPLENIVRGRRADIMSDLEASLAHQAPQQVDNPGLHELPPLNIDGIPTPVDKMTQAQLRAFIPEMLKYSTGRSKPGWGKMECRPMWWPDDVPWANVRSDVRTEEQKKKVSWTHALRTIVKNCYRHHNRDDLLPEFQQEESQLPTVQAVSVHSVHFPHQQMVQTINNPDGTISVIQIDTGDSSTPQVITLADGTQAQVVHTLPNGLHNVQEQAVHTLAEVAATQQEVAGLTHVDVSSHGQGHQGVATLAEAAINSEGQLILSGDPNALASAGMVTIPVTMYQSVVTSLSQLGEVQTAHIGQQSLGGPGGTLQVITPDQMEETVTDPDQSGEDVDDSQVMGDDDDDVDDIKPLITHVTLEHQNGDVPDATQAVEVMSVDHS